MRIMAMDEEHSLTEKTAVRVATVMVEAIHQCLIKSKTNI
jgi:hypothetical protein